MSGRSRAGRRLARDVETPSPGGLFDRAHRLTTAGLLMLVTFVAFESIAVGTAMPTAVAELDGLAWYGWPFSAYLVASVVGMVVGGGVGDRRGPRTALGGGGGVFAARLLAGGPARGHGPVVRRPGVPGPGG